MKQIQVDSYYKMPIIFFVPRPSPDQTTGPNLVKFCMVPYLVILRGLVEGFFRFRSGGLEMGYPKGPPWGLKILENFFLIFFIFLTEIGTWISKSLVKVKTSLKFSGFE